jgi:exosortase/archaeosortase family protein
MGKIEYEGKVYEFDYKGLIILGIFGPLISLLIYYSNDYVWLHEITAKITVFTLNLLTGLDNQVVWAEYSTELGLPNYSNWNPGWFIIIVGKETGPIRFTTFCTGIQAISIFTGVILAIPHSKDEVTSKDIWQRKAKGVFICSLLFYVVNIVRMWIQLYLYQIGYAWDDIHYSISAASSFIAIVAILVMHKYTPEFIMSLLWLGDQVRAALKKGKIDPKELEKIEEEIASEESSDAKENLEKDDKETDKPIKDNSEKLDPEKEVASGKKEEKSIKNDS